MRSWLHTKYIYKSVKLEDGAVQKENQDWGGYAYYKKIVRAIKKWMVLEADWLTKESGD